MSQGLRGTNEALQASLLLHPPVPHTTVVAEAYAQNLILVNLILVNFFSFLVITRDHGSYEGRH